jgi:TPR repeat protein
MASKIDKADEANRLFIKSERLGDTGEHRKAFRLLLQSAKLGHSGAQINLGNAYANGTGVRKNLLSAEHWYKRAFKAGERSGAHNLAIDKRNSGNTRSAVIWFKKAIAMGDGSACVELAKIYRARNRSKQSAIALLHQVLRMTPSDASELDKEQASHILSEIGE